MSSRYRRIAVIPDTQHKDGVPEKHLTAIGNYIADKKPEVVLHLGDHADMPSLSSYDIGKVSAEGKRVKADVEAAKRGMKLLTDPIRKAKGYSPELHICLGNHESRLDRFAEDHPSMFGHISTADLKYESFGFQVHPFLDVVTIDDIEFSHYFVSGALGRPVTSAAALLRTRHKSAIMGHVQRHDVAVHPTTQAIGLFAGIAYQHSEVYLTSQGNSTKRGIWFLNEVRGGTFDLMFVSLGFLLRRYA